jgi:DNA recombination protein RmuC
MSVAGVIGVLLGLLLGWVLGWLLARSRSQTQIAALEAEIRHARDDEARFELLASRTVDAAAHGAANKVSGLIDPIEKALEGVSKEVAELETARTRDYGALTAGLTSLTSTTSSLATALRSPEVRGRWGEMQLRNTVEAAGMIEFCDFVEQVSATSDEGRLRPDMVVRLPGGRSVVVDAKTSLKALLDAEAAPTAEAREAFLADYVRHVRENVTKLSQKGYWQQFTPAPDFVIMFLPGEGFYRTAIERDPSLLELAPGQRVHIASPSTLITLLRAIAVGWRESEVAENAKAIEQLGRELYERLATMTDHFSTLGKRLDGAVQAYNQSVGSLERRVLVSARRFVEHGVGADKELGELAPIETSAQPPQTVELPPRAADAA